jgi:hypothetical protein
VIQITSILVKVCLTKLTQALRHGIAAEPDPGRQLQAKAGGVTPAGLFSFGGGTAERIQAGEAANF